MKTYFICSDIHSFYDEWQKALNDSGYDKNNVNHILVILGDIFDRGKKPKDVYEFIKNIHVNRRILIKGNHEEILTDIVDKYNILKNKPLTKYSALFDSYFDTTDYYNGTVSTLCDLFGYDINDIIHNPLTLQKQLIETFKASGLYNWLQSKEWLNFYETKHYIFEHCFIPLTNPTVIHIYNQYPNYNLQYNPNWRTEATPKELSESRWGCPWRLYSCGYFASEEKNNKTLVCGHWHTADFYEHLVLPGDEPIKGEKWEYIKNNCPIFYNPAYKIIGLDANTPVTHKVNIFVIEEKDL
jgi:hypothetical protein